MHFIRVPKLQKDKDKGTVLTGGEDSPIIVISKGNGEVDD